jgi:hypothetical protein
MADTAGLSAVLDQARLEQQIGTSVPPCVAVNRQLAFGHRTRRQ